MGRKQQYKVILASSELSPKIATPFALNQAVIQNSHYHMFKLHLCCIRLVDDLIVLSQVAQLHYFCPINSTKSLRYPSASWIRILHILLLLYIWYRFSHNHNALNDIFFSSQPISKHSSIMKFLYSHHQVNQHPEDFSTSPVSSMCAHVELTGLMVYWQWNVKLYTSIYRT